MNTREFDPRAIYPAEPSKIERSDWETPPALFAREHAWHRFTIDVAANRLNALLPRYFDEEANGLRQSWLGERVWMHPPHGAVAEWTAKAYREATRGVRVVALLPVRTDEEWWQDHVLFSRFARVKFLTGKLDWRLHRMPIEAAVGRRKIEPPRGAWAIVEWNG